MSDPVLEKRLAQATRNTLRNKHILPLQTSHPDLSSLAESQIALPTSDAFLAERFTRSSLTEPTQTDLQTIPNRVRFSAKTAAPTTKDPAPITKDSTRGARDSPPSIEESPDSEMDRKLRQNKPRLLLMGQRRSGKSSITSVVFHKMPPQETLFLESTTRIQKDAMHSFMDFQVWDFPGQLDYFDPTFDTTDIFSEIGALVWVIDAQDDYSDSLNRLTTTILNLQTTFPHINVEVFVHKIDSLNDEFKADIFQDIVQRVGDELSDAGYINPNVNYHLTSIYDYSIFEAFSKVIQKLIPQLEMLENLLSILVNSCGMAKAYLFDTESKIYVASDTRPIDMEVYEMCSDYIDVIVDITDLYGYNRSQNNVLGEQMEEAESSVTIHDGTMIYLKEMNRYLCLVTVIKHDEAKDKKGLIDYNCHIFQDALTLTFARGWEKTQENGDEGAHNVPTSGAQGA